MMKKRSPLGFGERMRAARLAAGISLEKLSRTLGVTKGYLSRLESGKSRAAAELIQRLATILSLNDRELLLSAGYLPEDLRQLLSARPGEVESILRETFSPYGKNVPSVDPNATSAQVRPEATWSNRPSSLYTLVLDDCFKWLDRQAENSIHAVVTDPPYGLKEYSPEEKAKLRRGVGGVWRIPPKIDGYERSPLPRFTVLTRSDREFLRDFFHQWGKKVVRVLVPGGHVFIATNPLVSHWLYSGLEDAGFEKRGEIIRLVQTLRGGDRPKNAHNEFSQVTVMPRSAWEPWGLFRKPCEGRVQDNLRKWKTGGLRRLSEDQPLTDVIRSSPTRSSERELAPHPSLKPQSFMRQIVRASLPLGEGVVLDPFLGAGSTIAAATHLGYRSVGVELDEEYFRIAKTAIPRLAAMNGMTNGYPSSTLAVQDPLFESQGG